ncbi:MULTISPECIES: hypothetical protein [unclassified Microcoleus]|nr:MULTISPECIES: hypothetical protein [unclassified Microcoleus]
MSLTWIQYCTKSSILVPLFALWFGIGTVPAILTAFLRAFSRS